MAIKFGNTIKYSGIYLTGIKLNGISDNRNTTDYIRNIIKELGINLINVENKFKERELYFSCDNLQNMEFFKYLLDKREKQIKNLYANLRHEFLPHEI